MPRTLVSASTVGALTVAALTLFVVTPAVPIPTDVALPTGLPVGSRLLGVH